MGAVEVIRRLQDVGVHLSIDRDRLLARPASKIPDDLDIEIRRYKHDIIVELSRAKYRRVYPDAQATQAELADIERRVNETGVCMAWCSVVEDFVAFVASEDDANSVPPGFTVYTELELFLLFNEAEPDWTPDGLRRIHTYKKAGLYITDIRDLTQMGSDGD